MTTRFQIVIDCADPGLLAKFWAQALGYEFEPPPEGFEDWDAYWRSVGVPEDELDGSADRIVDPTGGGPRIWFQAVPEGKTIKNRIHFDIRASGGREGNPIEVRKQRVDALAEKLVAAGATMVRVLPMDGLDHYAVAMLDPEGNEFDVN
jgi:hypothetical protein